MIGKDCSSNGSSLVVCSNGSYAPLSGRFWSAGDYEVQPNRQILCLYQGDFGNRLCVYPKFLHSNATSHKWVFGAIAELLDNAFDEISNGATFVKIDKLSNQHSSKPSLLIQDDGGGMDPILLWRCMNFGFSNKEASSSIGQCMLLNLYLDMPDNFRIILRGCEVEHHYIARDLKYCEYPFHHGANHRGKGVVGVALSASLLVPLQNINMHYTYGFQSQCKFSACSRIGMKRRPEESIEKKESPRKQANYNLGKEPVEQTKFRSEPSNCAGWQKGVDIKALIQEDIEACGEWSAS